MPPALSEAIALARDTGNRAVLEAMVDAAKRRYPSLSGELESLLQIPVVYGTATPLSRAVMGERKPAPRAQPRPPQTSAASLAFDPEIDKKVNQPPAGFWESFTGEIALSVNFERDDTNEREAALAASLKYQRGPWTNESETRVRFRTVDGNAVNEDYRAESNLSYDLSTRNFLFGELQFRRDLFSNLELQIEQRAGAGLTLLRGDKRSLRTSAALGAEQSRRDTFGASLVQSGLGTLSADFDWAVTERLDFSQDANVDWLFGEASGLAYEAETRLTAQATERIFGRLRYRIEQFANLDDNGVEQELTVDVGYSF